MTGHRDVVCVGLLLRSRVGSHIDLVFHPPDRDKVHSKFPGADWLRVKQTWVVHNIVPTWNVNYTTTAAEAPIREVNDLSKRQRNVVLVHMWLSLILGSSRKLSSCDVWLVTSCSWMSIVVCCDYYTIMTHNSFRQATEGAIVYIIYVLGDHGQEYNRARASRRLRSSRWYLARRWTL